MPRRKRAYRSKTAVHSDEKGVWVLTGFLALCLVSFYLWARVQIDPLLLEVNRREREKTYLIQKAKDLERQIVYLKGYERISREARAMGLVPLKSGSVGSLPVDLSDLEEPVVLPRILWREAGVQAIPIRR